MKGSCKPQACRGGKLISGLALGCTLIISMGQTACVISRAEITGGNPKTPLAPAHQPEIRGTDPNPAASLFARATRAMEQGDDESALADLKQIVSLAPQLSAPHNHLGFLYKKKGLLDQAITEYQEAIRLHPEYAEVFNNLAIAYRERGFFQEAESAYLEAIRLKPDLAEAHFNLGVLYELYLGRPDQAARHYRDYIAIGGPRIAEVKIWISGLEQKRDGD